MSAPDPCVMWITFLRGYLKYVRKKRFSLEKDLLSFKIASVLRRENHSELGIKSFLKGFLMRLGEDLPNKHEALGKSEPGNQTYTELM